MKAATSHRCRDSDELQIEDADTYDVDQGWPKTTGPRPGLPLGQVADAHRLSRNQSDLVLQPWAA